MKQTEIEELYKNDCFTADLIENVQAINSKINVSLYGDETIEPYGIIEGKKEPLLDPVDDEVVEEIECSFIEVRYVIDKDNDSIMCLLGFDQDENFYIIDNFDDLQDDCARLIDKPVEEIQKLFNDYNRKG